MYLQVIASRPPSRSPYGERGLKYLGEITAMLDCRRSPYGERGLKYIEIVFSIPRDSRSPYGERGLKFRWFDS